MSGVKGQVRTVSRAKAQTRAWQSMRILRIFTLPQIVITAEISHNNLRKYARKLERAGYLHRLPHLNVGRPGSHIRYRLVQDSGPLAPMPRKWSDEVYDQNLKQVFGEEPTDVRD